MYTNFTQEQQEQKSTDYFQILIEYSERSYSEKLNKFNKFKINKII